MKITTQLVKDHLFADNTALITQSTDTNNFLLWNEVWKSVWRKYSSSTFCCQKVPLTFHIYQLDQAECTSGICRCQTRQRGSQLEKANLVFCVSGSIRTQGKIKIYNSVVLNFGGKTLPGMYPVVTNQQNPCGNTHATLYTLSNIISAPVQWSNFITNTEVYKNK